jgi:hypothetical protein
MTVQLERLYATLRMCGHLPEQDETEKDETEVRPS